MLATPDELVAWALLLALVPLLVATRRMHEALERNDLPAAGAEAEQALQLVAAATGTALLLQWIAR